MNLFEIFQEHELYHSNFQIDNFIVNNSNMTTYGKYKQSLRELYKRFRGLKSLYDEKEKIDKEKIFDLYENGKSIKDTEREFIYFYSKVISYKNELGEITEEKRNILDKEMWIENIKKQCAIDYISNGRISKNILELIFSCDKETKKTLLKEVKQQENLIRWFESYDNSDSKEIKKLQEKIYNDLKNKNIKELVNNNLKFLE